MEDKKGYDLKKKSIRFLTSSLVFSLAIAILSAIILSHLNSIVDRVFQERIRDKHSYAKVSLNKQLSDLSVRCDGLKTDLYAISDMKTVELTEVDGKYQLTGTHAGTGDREFEYRFISEKQKVQLPDIDMVFESIAIRYPTLLRLELPLSDGILEIYKAIPLSIEHPLGNTKKYSSPTGISVYIRGSESGSLYALFFSVPLSSSQNYAGVRMVVIAPITHLAANIASECEISSLFMLHGNDIISSFGTDKLNKNGDGVYPFEKIVTAETQDGCHFYSKREVPTLGVMFTIVEPIQKQYFSLFLIPVLIFVGLMLLGSMLMLYFFYRERTEILREEEEELSRWSAIQQMVSKQWSDLREFTELGGSTTISERSETSDDVVSQIRRLFSKYNNLFEIQLENREADHSLAGVLDIAVINLDSKGKLSSASKYFYSMINSSEDDCVGKSFSSFLAGEKDKNKFNKEWEFICQQGKSSFEVSLKTNSSQTIIIQVSAFPIFYSGGSLFGAKLFAHNKSKMYLKAMGAFSRERLEDFSKLAADIAHDFNNALCAILGGVSLIELKARDRNPDLYNEILRDKIQSIRTAAERATALVRRMMRLSPGKTTETETTPVLEGVKSLVSAYGKGKFTIDEERCNISAEVIVSRLTFDKVILGAMEHILKKAGKDNEIRIRLKANYINELPVAGILGKGVNSEVCLIELSAQKEDASSVGALSADAACGSLKWMEIQRKVTNISGLVLEDLPMLPLPNIVISLPLCERDPQKPVPHN